MNGGICIAHMFISNLIKFLYIHAIYFRLSTLPKYKRGKLHISKGIRNELYLLETTLGNNFKIRIIKLVKKKNNTIYVDSKQINIQAHVKCQRFSVGLKNILIEWKS